MAKAISSDDAGYLATVFGTKEKYKPYCREQSPMGPASWVADASERDINVAVGSVQHEILDLDARIFMTPTGTYWLGRPAVHVGNDAWLTGIWRVVNGPKLEATSHTSTKSQDTSAPVKLALAA